MRNKNMKRMLAGTATVILAGSMVMGCLPACTNNDVITENTPLRIATDAFDGVFNPFFSTSGADSDVVSQTQISMLTTDANGLLVAGDEYPTVVKNYSVVTTGSLEANGNDYDNFYTDYYFAIKDDIVFSDGTPLTIHDVLFNMYMYLDRAYTGSATMYSVNIKGLNRYRTQTDNEAEQSQIDSMFDSKSTQVMQAIAEWADDETAPISDLNSKLQVGDNLETQSLKAYVEKSKEYFLEEMNTDWSSAEGSVDSQSYKDMGLTQPWEIFLYMYGSLGGITVTTTRRPDGTKLYTVNYNDWDKRAHDKESIIKTLHTNFYNENSLRAYKANVAQMFGMQWASSSSIKTYIANDLMGKYFDSIDMQYKNISGITVEKRSSIPTSTGGQTTLGKELDVLKIRINGVDPKAIYNFSFQVAPMHYYSTPELTAAAMAANVYSSSCADFGVQFASVDFMDKVRQKLLPMGAGPYKANAKTYSDFFNSSIVNFVRNDSFLLGKPKIKYIQFKTIASNQKFDMVTGATKEIDYADPNATQININKLKSLKSSGEPIEYADIENLGYGYIGVNAKFVKNIYVREAIMIAFNPQLALSYYGGMANTINRPMSKVSWAYPEGIESYFWNSENGFPTFDAEQAKTRINNLVMAAGYTSFNSNSVRTNASGDVLKYTFTIAGDSEDHPATATLNLAAEILNDCGFDITVTKDSNALRKLQSGDLEVWAAAWSSTIDPDMFQVYHMDSKATSVLNWGYDAILNDTSKYYDEYDIILNLSDIIDRAREIDDSDTEGVGRARRAELYAEALDLVMSLKVEFPLYQRDNLYVWNTKVINTESMHLEEVTAFRGPLSKIWEIELNITK